MASQDLSKLIFKKIVKKPRNQRAERSASQVRVAEDSSTENAPQSLETLLKQGVFTTQSNESFKPIASKSYSDLLQGLENLSEPLPDLSYSCLESDRRNRIDNTLRKVKKDKKLEEDKMQEQLRQQNFTVQNRRRRQKQQELLLDTIQDEADDE